MKIESVVAVNLREYIYDIESSVSSSESAKGSNFHYRASIESILNQCSVLYTVSELSMIEFFYLSQYASSTVIMETKVVNDAKVRNDDGAELTKLNSYIKNVTSLAESISADSDMPDVSAYITPMICIQHKAHFRFSGHAILSICGAFTNRIFEGCVPGENTENDKKISETLAKMLYNSFYTQMISNMNRSDLISEYTLDTKVFSQKKNVTLLNVRNSSGMLNFVDCSESNRALGMHDINEVIHDNNASVNVIMNDLKITLSITSTIAAMVFFSSRTNYLDLSGLYPLKLSTKGDKLSFPSEILTTYKTRLKNALGEYAKERIRRIEDGGINLINIYTTLPANTICKYTIELSLLDAHSLLKEFSGYYSYEESSKKESSIQRELSMIVSEIDKIQQTLIKVFFQ